MKVKFITAFAFLANFTFAQNTIKMTSNYGSKDSEIQTLIDFENIYIEQLNFEGANLKGKSYQIRLEEYVNGKLTKSSMLFDGSESDYFKIASEKDSLKFFFKLSDGRLKTFLCGNKFRSKKSYFKLADDADKYALKNFLGNKNEIQIETDKKNFIFAIITPTIHKDGSGSYCEVAQSDEKPENLGMKFKIPHYFLITLIFK
ncbi:hypothetical protein [Porphyromonas loveana]|uniref:hypothetical protein n=1 Tax=Porphyromonas loveana TaxID=1884669 RepID=UPI0035A0EA4A